MARKKITSQKYARQIASIAAGDRVQLAAGSYRQPLVFDAKVGTAQRPITIEPDASAAPGSVIFNSDLTQQQAREWANGVANRRQHAGYYPVVGHLADQAMLILRNCRFVVIRALDFHGCWPGGIYLDNCQYILIDDVWFKSGTIAIGANGRFTHDIVVQRCHWQQDTSAGVMWNQVPWGRIHGASSNSSQPDVNVTLDYRHWDGDFFRAWDIAGNVIIRDNTITDAFNAIHFFNSVDKLAPGVVADTLSFNSGRRASVNVLIENNHFVRIRDNVFEPEDHAWNWVIRHNRLIDCYRPFSLEFERAGYFYIYGNTGSFFNSPSSAIPKHETIPKQEWRQSFSLFKPKGVQANEGEINVFNNSWYFASGKGVLPKYGIGKLRHVNNVIQFADPRNANFFGRQGACQTSDDGAQGSEQKAEKKRFTRRWDHYQIEMDGDVTNDVHYPHKYRSVGYAIGSQALHSNPAFSQVFGSLECPADFTSHSAAVVGTSIAFSLRLPNAKAIVVTAESGHSRGAVQGAGLYHLVDKGFGFLADDSWLPELPVPSRDHCTPT